MPFTSASTCWSVKLPPALMAKGRHVRARFAVGNDLTQDLLIDQRLIRRIRQRVGRTVHSLGAVATGAVLARRA